MINDKSLEIPVKEKQEVSARQQKEQKYIGSMRHQPGHTLYEVNELTGEIKQADIVRKVEVGIDGKPQYRSIITIRENCAYIEALNIKNAKKRFLKMYLSK